MVTESSKHFKALLLIYWILKKKKKLLASILTIVFNLLRRRSEMNGVSLHFPPLQHYSYNSATFPQLNIFPNDHNPPPTNTFPPKCIPALQAIVYKNLGLKTVQMKRCVLNIVQAIIVAVKLLAMNIANRVIWLPQTFFRFTPSFFHNFNSRRLPAEVK